MLGAMMPQHRHEWHHTRPACDEQQGAPVASRPRERTSDRTPQLKRIARLGNLVEPRRDFTVFDQLDCQLENTLGFWRGCNGLAALCLPTALLATS